jgi:hypothetical protein
MEALRNNIQHHSLPVYQVNRPMEADDHEGGTRKMRHRADPRIKLSQLAQDKQNFSATLLQELRSFGNGDLIAVAPLVRGYVQSLGRIQKAVRIAVAPDVSHWDGELLTVLEQAQTAFGTTSAVVVGCYLTDADDESTVGREEDLFRDLIDHRRYLERRAQHADLMPGSNDYVSSE